MKQRRVVISRLDVDSPGRQAGELRADLMFVPGVWLHEDPRDTARHPSQLLHVGERRKRNRTMHKLADLAFPERDPQQGSDRARPDLKT